jgi:hypothetical protein
MFNKQILDKIIAINQLDLDRFLKNSLANRIIEAGLISSFKWVESKKDGSSDAQLQAQFKSLIVKIDFSHSSNDLSATCSYSICQYTRTCEHIVATLLIVNALTKQQAFLPESLNLNKNNFIEQLDL